jgi:hypothetical protein
MRQRCRGDEVVIRMTVSVHQMATLRGKLRQYVGSVGVEQREPEPEILRYKTRRKLEAR